MITQAFCRDMKPGEEREVEALLQQGFGGHAEARLVDRLRREGRIAGEMVLPGPDGLIGYYALSWLEAPADWLALAPVVIHPDWQRHGHGRRMIGQLSAWAVAARQMVVVLGDTGFYERVGFSGLRARQLTGPCPSEHMALAGPGEDAPAARLRYPPAFGSET